METDKTGNKIRYNGVYRLYRNGLLVKETTFNLLNAFGSTPAITLEELEAMTTTDIETRASLMIEAINDKCNDFKLINNVIYNPGDCFGENEETMVGQIIDFAGQIGTWDSTKWMECAGQLVSVLDYPELYQVIGREWTYDAGIPANKFNIPDLRGKVTLGVDENSPVTPRDSYFDYTLPGESYVRKTNYGRVGNYGGRYEVKITQYELTNHRHLMFAAEGATGAPSGFDLTADQKVTANRELGGNLSYRMGKTKVEATLGLTGSAGLGLPLENRQPYVVVYKLIRFI
jgi:microcystin-dependent protein